MFFRRHREMRKIPKVYQDFYLHQYEFQCLEILCSKDKVSVDVGSNIGAFTYKMAEYSKHTYCFEPNLYLIQLMNENFSKDNITSHGVALSDRNGSGVLYTPMHKRDQFFDANLASLNKINRTENIIEVGEEEIELRTLDSYKLENVGFIKVDVEGAEEAFLMGARETINNSKPNFIIEIEQRHLEEDINKVFNLFFDMDYSLFFHNESKLHDFEKFNLKENQLDHLNQFNEIVPKVGTRDLERYINNFFAIHKSNLDTLYPKLKKFRFYK